MARVTSISTLGWSHYTLYEALPQIAARGFRRVEIASFNSYCFHFNCGSPTPHELKDMLKQNGLTPVCFHYSAGWYEAWKPEHIKKFISDWTKKLEQLPELGIAMMSMVFGERNTRNDQEFQLANAVKAYDAIAKIARRSGIRMLLEVPHVYTIMPRPEQVYWLFDRLNSDNIGALVDSSHWGVIGYNLDEFFSRLGKRLWHIHLRDSKGADTADRKQNLELTPGKGSVDFRKFARALDSVGYNGDVTLEFEYRDMPLAEIEHEYDLGLKHLVNCGWEIPDGVKIG